MNLFPDDDDDEQSPPVPFDEKQLLAALKGLIEALPTEAVDLSTLSLTRRKKLIEKIEQAIASLERVKTDLDPIKLPAYVLDPSHPSVVGKLIANTLLLQPRHAFATLPRFYGSGVYAIYYSGDFDAYQPLKGSETPIYIGKADPEYQEATTPREQGTKLWGRLVEHKGSIEEANSTLDVNDFTCRYLVVKSAWQGTAENYLIGRFKPIWNSETKICYGFGKHGDSASTRANKRSPWDTLHPGRPWATTADNVPSKFTPEQIKERIAEHFKRYPPDEP